MSEAKSSTARKKAASTVRNTSSKARQKKTPLTITAEERIRMIREAAWLRAERRGFVGGSPEQDWLEAEQEIDTMLMQQG